MSFLDWVHISNKFIEGNIRIIKQVEEVQDYKLAELLGSKLQHDPNKVIHNYSSYDLWKADISLLLKGLNFSLPPKKLKFENYLPFELLYRDILHNEKDINDSLIHLKSKLKSLVCHPLDFPIRKIIGFLIINLKKNMKPLSTFKLIKT